MNKKNTKIVVTSAGLSADSIARVGQVSEVPEKAAQQLKKLSKKLSSGKKARALCGKQNKIARKLARKSKGLRIQASRANAAAIALAA